MLPLSATQDSLVTKLLALEQRIFLSQNEREKNSLVIEKVNLYIANGESGEDALSEIRRVKAELITDTASRRIFLWNASLIAHLNHNFTLADSYFANYLRDKKDTSATDAIFASLIYTNYDTSKVSFFSRLAAIKDSTLSCVSCLNDAVRYKKKGKDFIVFSSYLIPGSGSMMLGHVLKGAVSLMIFAAIGSGVYFLVVNELYLNAALFAAPWLFKFYGGQVRLTRKLFDQREEKSKQKIAAKCATQMDTVLLKYPIGFKR